MEATMNIAELEYRYQALVSDFQAAKISQVEFEAALDKLQFQDNQGRHWMIGTQSGNWYYYTGQTWQRGNPRQIQPLKHSRPQSRTRSKSIRGWASLAMIFVALLLLPLWVLSVSGAPPAGMPPPAPSPRPPLDSGDSDGEASGSHSSINGIVTDLSTNQPGAGIEVSISGQIVRTDTNGSYSITGLNPGIYAVSPELYGQGTPAQGPVSVVLDGVHSQTVDLGFYTQSPPLPTDTPIPTTQPTSTVSPKTTPIALPPAGAPISHRPLVIVGIGLFLVATGGILLVVKN